MALHYLHLLTTDGLSCYQAERDSLTFSAHFTAQINGYSGFAQWLKQVKTGLHTVLVDLPDEGFQADTVPAVRGGDRKALIARRLTQYFFGTPFSAALSLGRQVDGRRDERLLYTALTRPAALEPWLAALTQQRAMLCGIYTPGLLTESLLKLAAPLLAPAIGNSGLILMLSNAGIRQIYYENGRLRFSRLSPHTETPFAERGELCYQETRSTYQYLNAQRWLSRNDTLHVTLCCAARDQSPLLNSIQAHVKPNEKLRFHAIQLEQLHQAIGLKAPQLSSDAHPLLSKLATNLRGKKTQLASAVTRHFYQLWRIRFACLSLGFGMLIASAVLSAKWLYDAQQAQTHITQLKTDIAQSEARYQALLSSLPKSLGTLSNLQATATQLQQIEQQRLSPSSALMRISQVFDRFSDIQLDDVLWQNTQWHKADEKPDTKAAAKHLITLSVSLNTAHADDPQAVAQRFQAFSTALASLPGAQLTVLAQSFDMRTDKALSSTQKNASQRPSLQLTLQLPEVAS